MQHPYHIRGGYLSSTLCRIYVQRSNTQFHISIPSSSVQHTALGRQVFSLIFHINNLDRPSQETTFAPYRLILNHFLPLLETLAPKMEVEGLSIDYFVNAPTYKLEVFGMGNGELGVKGEDTGTLESAYDIASLSLSSAPEFYKSIPRTEASDLIPAKPTEEMSPLETLQGKVKFKTPTTTTSSSPSSAPGQGSLKFFKPRERGREKEFTREVKLLHLLKQKNLAGSVHRLPILESLVVSKSAQDKDDLIIVGFLTNYISGSHLQSPGIRHQTSLHKKCENQVRKTVTLLHEHDIVWGDVNPCNVVIDEEMNAWVIDFGGRNTVGVVDDEKAETREGDWQGVQRLFGEWLPGDGD